ncbi:lysosomal-associated transmembrane protein 5-like [Rhinatrema bivittatum]|uniref:lysosomal-associated transmembrane protein 5-like n=1 Tax=Rhinatrema bivittatum TaxID=194408 RepID=UPI00112ECC71|nr:lysosomal-associated transmembrane protein 5-like [Rhinatrema bivittatum]
MRAQESPEMPTCCGCFSVRAGTLGLAVYYLTFSVIYLAWQAVEATVKGPEAGLLDFLVGLLLLAICLALLVGVLKNREGLLVPFLLFQALDVLLTLLTIFGCLLQFSSYLQVLCPRRAHPYLLAEPEFASSVSAVVYLALVFTALLLLKVYLLRCVWSCYRHIQACRQARREQVPGSEEKGLFFVLPTYEEALKLPPKEDLPPPPSYCSAAIDLGELTNSSWSHQKGGLS